MKRLLSVSFALTVLTFAACNREPEKGPEPKAITAKLTVVLNPTCLSGSGPEGHGTVTFAPAPLSVSGNCKLEGNSLVTCIAEFTKGQSVTVKAIGDPKLHPTIPEPMSYVGEFRGIPGCPPAQTNVFRQELSCPLTMDTDKEVSALFCSRIF